MPNLPAPTPHPKRQPHLTLALVTYLLSTLAWLTPATAQTPAFASLSVEPAGRQTIDIISGVTTLPDGGSVVDRDTGVSLEAERISYRDGHFIEATGVVVEGSFGTLTAEYLHIDVPTGLLTANGSLRLEREGLSVVADELRYYAEAQVAVFDGAVRGTAPNFQTERLLLDADSGDVLLVGRYAYADGLLTLASPESGGRLELRLSLNEGTASYDAATEVRPEVLARFADYL